MQPFIIINIFLVVWCQRLNQMMGKNVFEVSQHKKSTPHFLHVSKSVMVVSTSLGNDALRLLQAIQLSRYEIRRCVCSSSFPHPTPKTMYCYFLSRKSKKYLHKKKRIVGLQVHYSHISSCWNCTRNKWSDKHTLIIIICFKSKPCW